jgi:hypothetical protein
VGSGTADPPPPLPTCTPSPVAPAMLPDDFCALFLATCGTVYPGFATFTDCEKTYTSLAATPNRQMCQSYHVCNAVHAPSAVHCPHAAGQVVCTMPN